MKLPRIYEYFKQGQIFTIDEAREKLQTSGNTLRKRLSDLSQKGYLSHIRQGLYRLTNIDEKIIFNKKMPSPFAIASKLSGNCYIGFRSALQFHAQIAPETESIIYVVSSTKFNSFKFAGITYFWCQNPNSTGLETYIINDHGIEHPVIFTNFEKTLVDCLKRPAHCPSFEELIYLCQKINQKPDLEKVFTYASHYQVQAIFNRLGILFERNSSHWGIETAFLAKIEKKMSRKQIEWPILYNISNENDSLKNRWKISFL